MNGVTQREWSFLLLLWGLSDPRIAELRKMPQSFIIKLYSETQVSGRLGMSGGISPRHAQNPLSGERRKTLSITHHALSPPPSHYHLYIIHLINWLQRFYRITMSLKRPFVPKSDVKQRFTTTTQSTHHPQEVPLAQFSLYVHKGGLKPDSFHLLEAECGINKILRKGGEINNLFSAKAPASPPAPQPPPQYFKIIAIEGFSLQNV